MNLSGNVMNALCHSAFTLKYWIFKDKVILDVF